MAMNGFGAAPGMFVLLPPADPSLAQPFGLLPPAAPPTLGVLNIPGDPSSLFGSPFGATPGIGALQFQGLFGGISPAAAQADVPVRTVARPTGAGMASSDAQWSGGLARSMRILGPANFGQTPENGTADPAGAAFQTVLNGARFSATPGGTPQWFSATPGQPDADEVFTRLTGKPPAYDESGRASGQANLGNGMIANITAYRARSTEGPSIQFSIKQSIVFRGVDGRALSQPEDIIGGKIRF
jgi:hypothetical protein